MAKKIVVIGAGAWGGWTAFNLQKAGCEVTLIDQHGSGNALSGSGDLTRIIRMAYGGDKNYSALTARSFELWRKYSMEFGTQMIYDKKALWIFRGINPAYAEESVPLMSEMGFKLEELPVDVLKSQYPQINFTDITSAYLEHDSAYLLASESCQQVFRQFQLLGGAFVQEKVTELVREGSQVSAVRLATGELIIADSFVLACGPWLKQLVPEVSSLIRVSRQEVYYFDVPETYHDLPIWVEFREGEEMFYGIPDHFRHGFKFAYDERTWLLDPDSDHRHITEEILEKMKRVLLNRFPELEDPKVLRHHTCVYENSPDGDFIIDKVPEARNAIMMAGSSGHGYKMGPALGELITEHFMNSRPIPTEFSFSRFQNSYQSKTQYQLR